MAALTSPECPAWFLLKPLEIRPEPEADAAAFLRGTQRLTEGLSNVFLVNSVGDASLDV